MKLKITKAVLLVLAVSTMGSQGYAASGSDLVGNISSPGLKNMQLANHLPVTEEHLQACYDKYFSVPRTHECRKNLSTQEGFRGNPDFISCIKKSQNICEEQGPGHG